MATLQGRRREADVDAHDLAVGDYRAPTDGVMWARCPTGDLCRIDERWKITEHENGTISVGPLQPGGSLSIAIQPSGWHGFLEYGVWRDA